MFGYPEEIRRAIYTTNAIESLNMSLRKIIKTRASFPNEEAAFKLRYLALKRIAKKWTMPIKNWRAAMNQFAIIFEGRVPLGIDVMKLNWMRGGTRPDCTSAARLNYFTTSYHHRLTSIFRRLPFPGVRPSPQPAAPHQPASLQS